MHFKLLILICGMLAFSIAQAEENCLSNNFLIDQRPSLRGIKTVDDFFNWRSYLHFSESSVAKVSLAKRAFVNGPTSLAGFDIDDRAWLYDFLSTLWSEGGCGSYKKTTETRYANNVYNFKFWQYIDISYYFGHSLVTVPPTMWTNAAHKNGVKSLGTFDLNEIDPHLLFDEPKLIQTINVLLDLAKTLSFDGFLINYEYNDSSILKPLLVLMEKLKKAGLTIIWYDSPLSGGFANYLNEEAIPFLETAGYFHSNYWWNYPAGFPAQSYQTLVRHKLDHLKNNVFQMGDVYRDPYKTNPFAICLPNDVNPHFTRFKDIFTNHTLTSFYTGMGFYAPNWTMFGGNADPVTDTNVPDVYRFEQSDAAFWEGSGPYGCGPADFRNASYFVQPRTVITQLPFYTNFNTGVGEKFFLEGEVASIGSWSNFTLQAILPTWQGVAWNATKINSYFDYQNAYEGGASWKVVTLTDNIIKLYKTDFLTHKNDKLEIILNMSYDPKNFKMRVNQTTQSPNQVVLLKNGWKKLIFNLPSQTTIKELDVVVKAGTTSLGSLKIYSDNLLGPQNQLAKKAGNVLTWEPKQVGSRFRIYGHKDDGKFVLLNEVANTTYDLRGNIFNGANDVSEFSDYLIQEVTLAGDYQNFRKM